MCIRDSAEFACEGVVRGIIESLVGVKVDNNHYSYLIYPGSYFILEDIQVGQALLSLGESMLTTLEHLFVSHGDRRDGPKKKALNHLYRN